MRNILHRENLKVLYILAIIAFGLFMLFFINNLLLSSVLAFVIFYLLAPVINYFERKGFNRGLAIFTIYTLNTITVVIAFWIFIPLLIEQFYLLEKELPSLQEGVLNLVAKVENRLGYFSQLESLNLRDKLGQWMIAQTTLFSTWIPYWVGNSLTTLFLTPFLAFFMLRDGSRAKRTILDLIPNRFFEVSLRLVYEMNEQVGSFIRARIAEALIVGLVTWIGLLIIGFPYAILLALFAALTNLIPYLGPVLGTVPALVIILVNPNLLFESMGMSFLAVGIVYLTAQLLDALIIIPVVVAKIVNLHPVTVILVIILGAQVLGVLGMIISIPVASLAKLFVTTLYQQTARTP
ncbi:MAG: AI-2E family transporter [Bdellovibrionales bacterium]|nr:AI-2E family transporter [Bdellovibrionales bacterium]